jgi:hypothetical protein
MAGQEQLQHLFKQSGGGYIPQQWSKITNRRGGIAVYLQI